MRIVFLSTHDICGGASRSAIRLMHKVKEDTSFKVCMLVKSKLSSYSDVKVLPQPLFVRVYHKIIKVFESAVFRKNEKSQGLFWSYNFLPRVFNNTAVNKGADIVHIHWVGDGFLPVKALKKIYKPIVWTLHDSAAFTGGCHIPLECKNYSTDCNQCPQLSNSIVCRRTLRIKSKEWDKLNISVVTPSNWLAKCARESKVFKNKSIYVIPNGIDCELYRPIDKTTARDILRLNSKKQYILFGAMNSTNDINKGFNLLLNALSKLNINSEVELIVFGGESTHLNALENIKINYIGTIMDEITLPIVYSAANVFVCPSLSENLPNTVLESMACGTPVTAFNIGGIPDIIDHSLDGYLAQPYISDDLLAGVEWCLQNSILVGERARQKITNNFNIELIASKYKSLYANVMRNDKEPLDNRYARI